MVHSTGCALALQLIIPLAPRFRLIRNDSRNKARDPYGREGKFESQDRLMRSGGLVIRELPRAFETSPKYSGSFQSRGQFEFRQAARLSGSQR
jgi:hypothetical protein